MNDRRTFLAALAALPIAMRAGSALAQAPADGRLVEHPAMASAHAQTRDVTVWLPPGYDAAPDRRWPVLYMHDGQNLFDNTRAYSTEWGIDEHITRLAANGQIRAPIVVGVHNTPLRMREYAPTEMMQALPDNLRVDLEGMYGGASLADGYLRFLVEDLKPMIDGAYRTLRGRDDTVIMGSSMGGSISLYALMKYPDIYGSAGCLSTHWPVRMAQPPETVPEGWNDTVLQLWAQAVGKALPDPATHKLYFDLGSEMEFPLHATFQRRIEHVVRDKGWTPDRLRTLVFPGAAHNELAWNQRLDTPLTFLLPAK